MGRGSEVLAKSLRDMRDMLTAPLRSMGSWCRQPGYVRLVTAVLTLALVLVPSHGLGMDSRGPKGNGHASDGALRSGLLRRSLGSESATPASEVSSGSRQVASRRFPTGSTAPLHLRGVPDADGPRIRRQLQQKEWVREESNMLGLVKELESELDASTPCNRSMLAEMRAFFHSIVLIVHCEDEAFLRNTTSFWGKVYRERLFKHVVFLSANPDPALGVEARATRPWRWDWHYSYFGLPKIMARFPDAEGFLWSNDDVVINYWNLLKADKSRIWLPNDPRHSETRFFPIDSGTRSQWPDDWPSQPQRRMQAAAAWGLLEGGQKRQYRTNLGLPLGVPIVFQKRVCDLFYIPRRHVEAFAFDLLPFFREAHVASQVAIPTMFYILDHPREFDPVLNDMVYRWDTLQGKQSPRQVWIPDVAGLRPWKVHDVRGQRDVLLLLSERDSCILDEFTIRDPKGSA